MELIKEHFIKASIAHYKWKLEEETEQFGVLGTSTTCIENNACKVVDDEHAGHIWRELSEQSNLHLHVDYVPNDTQAVYAILSKETIPHPNHYYELWEIVEDLKSDEPIEEKIYMLVHYNGPYKYGDASEYIE